MKLAVLKRGTASEHTGVVLETEAGESVQLVRLGGNPFNDQQTRNLVGRTVEVKGYRLGSELRFVHARQIG